MAGTIDIDTGGTFTDGFIFYQGRVETVKVPTTAHDLTVCFLDCLKAAARRLGLSLDDLLHQTDVIRFSNTIGTNTIIQRDGSKVGLLVTAGLEHLAPTGNGSGPARLVDPEMVTGVAEVTAADGRVLAVPDGTTAMAAAQELIDRGARCLVVAFQNSQSNPANERLVRRTIKQEYPRDYLGSVPVFLSSDISFRSGDGPRINTAVISAYIHGKLARLLYKAEEELRRRHYQGILFIGHNNGAVARVARTRAINTYNSGPAAGLAGAELIGRLYGFPDLISGDMGGTSFDLGYVREGTAGYTLDTDVEGFQVNVPMLNIRAIGAGGGSLAAVEDGELRVGPQSAGAMPGPACFDLGGVEPTVTDADVVLGIIAPDNFLGGGMSLNREKARQAIADKIAGPLGCSVEEAALAIRRTIDQVMGRELARLKQDIFPNSQPALLIYGGAGPAHCGEVARLAGIGKIIITPFSSVFSAFSSASMDVGHVYYRRLDLPLSQGVTTECLNDTLAELRDLAERDMRGEGFSVAEMKTSLELFVSDGLHETRLVAGAGPIEDWEALIRRAQAEPTLDRARPMTLSGLGLRATAPAPHYPIPVVPVTELKLEEARRGTRSVYLESGQSPMDLPIYNLTGLGHGHRIQGPALVESDFTTVFVPSEWNLAVDRYNHLVLEEVV